MSDRRPPGVAPTVTSVDVIARFSPGTLVAGRYRIVGVAGVGGMGVVYHARDEELGVDVALKVLRPDLGADPSVVERFRSELKLAREVSHKNVVRIHDIGEHEGFRFLTMRYVEGRPLSAVIEKEGRLAPERAVAIARQIASALGEAHRAGVIHRDLKPGNVLLDSEDVAYVTDFGVARSVGGDGLTRAGAVVGTPDYLSPEQIAGEEVDGRADLYALGIVIFEMLTGELPFRPGSQSEMLAQRLAGRPRDLSETGVPAPRWLAAVVRRLLERRPAKRHPDAAALLEDLDRERAPRPASRLRMAAIAGAAVLMAFVVVAVLLRQRANVRDTSPASPPRPGAAAAARAREAVAILPLSDETATPELAWTSTGVPEMLAANLSETGELRILDSLRVLQNLRDLHLSPGKYDDAALGELAELWSAGRIVTGTVRRAGQRLRVDLRIVRAEAEGLSSRYVSAEAPGPEGLFEMVRNLSGRVRAELGFAASPTPEKAVATASFAAAKAYETGRQRLLAGDDLGAAPAFEQAVSADPGFAAALERLAETYQGLGRQDKAVAAVERAVTAVGGGESRIAYRIRARKALLEGRPEDAEKHFQELLRRYPFDAEPRLDLAAAQAAQGHNSDAVATLTKAVEFDPGDPRAWFLLGKNAILAGDSARAASDYLVRALALHTRLGNEKGKADVLNAMGVAHQQLGEYPRALESYTEAAAARERIGDERGVASTLRNRAMVNVSLGRSREAETDLDRARSLFEKIGDRGGLSDVMNDFGLVHEGRGAYTRALAAYQEALKIRRGMGDERLLSQSYDNVGYIYYLQGEYDNALVYWKQALDLRRKIGEKNGIVLSVQNMGFLQTAQGRWEEAMKSFLEALEDSRAIGFKNAEAISLGNLAMLSAYRGRFGAAIDSYSAALALLRPLDLKPALAEFTLKEGAVRLEIGQLEETKARLAAAETWLKETENREQSADLETLRGEWHAARGEIEPSHRAFSRAIALAKESGSKATLLHARIAAASAAATAGDAGATSELAKALAEAESLGHAVLTIRAAEGLARAELARGRPERTEELARRALAVAERAGWEAGRYRVRALLARALEARGQAAAANDAWRESAEEARRLGDNVPSSMRASFLALPAVKESLAHASQAKLGG